MKRHEFVGLALLFLIIIGCEEEIQIEKHPHFTLRHCNMLHARLTARM